jgi:hypothetical protein
MDRVMDLITGLTGLVTAIGVAINIYMTWRAKLDIHRVELATNSMKDALVANAGVMGEARGRAEAEKIKSQAPGAKPGT